MKYDKSQPATYYYATLNESNFEYAFAFNLADTDKVFRRALEPNGITGNTETRSYYNILVQYRKKEVQDALPSDTYRTLGLVDDDPAYPGLFISYKFVCGGVCEESGMLSARWFICIGRGTR